MKGLDKCYAQRKNSRFGKSDQKMLEKDGVGGRGGSLAQQGST